MTKLEEQLEKIRKEKNIGLMTHVVIGYPSLKETKKLVKTMEDAGVDLIELQIPFSNPLIAGPQIRHACEKSLKAGTTVADCFKTMEFLTRETAIPLLFMGYYNTIFSCGAKRFIEKAQNAGCSGIIIPDIPPDEEKKEKFIYYCNKYKIHHIRVISPVSYDERIKKNIEIANGFIYCTSRCGTTGDELHINYQLKACLKKIKRYTKLPIAVGFGISQKRHIQQLEGIAEIAVVGSAIIDLVEKYSIKDYLRYVSRFIRKIRP